MGGRSSKIKGRTQEYRLRDHLRAQGWTSERVYCSGAIKGLPGDVKATHPKHGEKLFEMKSRKSTFKKIYELYRSHVSKSGDDLLAFALAADESGRSMCVNVSTSLEAVLGGADHHPLVQHHPLGKDYVRTFRKIGNLKKLLGEAHILACKDDREPLLFFRFI